MSEDQHPDLPIVRLKSPDYKPSQAEMNEPIILRNPDGSRATPEDVARAVTRPVRVVRERD